MTHWLSGKTGRVVTPSPRAGRAIEPPPSRWQFPSDPLRLNIAARVRGAEVVAVGADLEPGTLLAAYRSGLFPMPARKRLPGWWSPEPRGIIPLEPGGLKVSRSLRKAVGRYETSIDSAFDEVIVACADRRRPGGWIDRDMIRAYTTLHELGWVHSVEAWDEDGGLAGGLYGVAVGGLFAGESMFHHRTDASKVALVRLVETLRAAGDAERRLLDVQWPTPHLKSLGAVEVTRQEYHRRLQEALSLPQPGCFGG